MEQLTVTAPLGFAVVKPARPAPAHAEPEAGDYVDPFSEADAPAADGPAAAVKGPATDAILPRAAPRAIPELPRPPAPPTSFTRQLAGLAALALGVGTIALVAARPPAAPAAPALPAERVAPAPGIVPSALPPPARVLRPARSHQAPIRRVSAPVEIDPGTPGAKPARPAPDAAAPAAPVSAPRLVPASDDAQSMKAPPLTGT
jgi:hypothetical protein